MLPISAVTSHSLARDITSHNPGFEAGLHVPADLGFTMAEMIPSSPWLGCAEESALSLRDRRLQMAGVFANRRQLAHANAAYGMRASGRRSVCRSAKDKNTRGGPHAKQLTSYSLYWKFNPLLLIEKLSFNWN